jgi:hypothetical protein
MGTYEFCCIAYVRACIDSHTCKFAKIDDEKAFLGRVFMWFVELAVLEALVFVWFGDDNGEI